ncbi:MAG: DUF4279 domain-containing protein [Terriglobia bacterium]
MHASVAKAPITALASVRIFGVDLDLDSISNHLGIQPSESHRKGDLSLPSRSYSEDMWRIDSPHPKTETLEVHLSWLGQVLVPRYDFIRRLRENHEVSSYCGISVDGDNCRFQISPESLRMFVDLGIAMNLTVIFIGGSESGSTSDAPGSARTESPGTITSLEATGKPSDLSEVARELNHLASYASRAGEPEASANAERPAFWALTAPEVLEGGLDAQLIWLATELMPYASFLRPITPRVGLLVRCVLRTESDISDQSLSPEGLSFLTSLEIPLEFDVSLVTAGG